VRRDLPRRQSGTRLNDSLTFARQAGRHGIAAETGLRPDGWHRPGADRAVGAVGHLPAGPERARGLADHTMTATVAVFLIGPPRAARSAVSTRRLPH
jgi:hypothetical protein